MYCHQNILYWLVLVAGRLVAGARFAGEGHQALSRPGDMILWELLDQAEGSAKSSNDDAQADKRSGEATANGKVIRC